MYAEIPLGLSAQHYIRPITQTTDNSPVCTDSFLIILEIGQPIVGRLAGA